ncbi:hypothetical protein MRX96_020732 [Rhipicephalus microplus]
MATSRAMHEVSPDAASTPVARSVSDTPRSRFSDEGYSILAILLDPNNAEVPGSSQRSIPTMGPAKNRGQRPIPTTEADQEEDARSSVSETTAVATGLRVDLGSRSMASV